jgi:hypothetical protein
MSKEVKSIDISRGYVEIPTTTQAFTCGGKMSPEPISFLFLSTDRVDR